MTDYKIIPRVDYHGTAVISVDEAAKEFHRSRNWIFHKIREGKLKRYRSEGDQRTLVNREDLRRLVEPESTQ